METRTKQIMLNGLEFQYRETGESTAPPLIALHALGQNAQAWDEVAAVLGQKYRVLALDQRGHGGSARPGVYSFELMCEDVLLFANAMEVERFTLLGHSMGGTVSYLFSERYPSRIEQLLIEDTPPPAIGDAPPSFSDEQVDIPLEQLPFDWRVVPSILEQLKEPNPEWWTRLSEIVAPTLIIGGGTTSHVPQIKLQEVAGLIPDSEFITIEGAGHFVHEAALPAYLEVVKAFLKIKHT
jgi:esterase